MKRFLPLLSSCLSLAILLACAFPAAPDALPAPPQAAAESPEAAAEEEEITLRVFDVSVGYTREIPLEEYTAAVVRAEMPLSYHPEALKAQAAAARTYALNKSARFGGAGCVRHPQADVCTESTCCQGCALSDAPDAAEAAARETRGLVIAFRGHPIHALYHACAGGHTEDAENVFSDAIAYLRGVPSPGEERYAQFSAALTLTLTQMQNAFADHENVVLLSEIPLSEQLEVLSRSPAGRVTEIRVGLTALSGSEFRRALDLRSANFSLAFAEDSVRFTTQGSGHGVGLSQTGADAMARSGSDWTEILLWYYSGVEIAEARALYN